MVPILIITTIIVLSFNDDLALIFGAFALLIIIGLILSIVYLFLHKIISVYRNVNGIKSDEESEEELIRVITKHTILTMSTITWTLLFIVVIILVATDKKNAAIHESIGDIVATGDVFVNFVCILLSMEYNKEWYNKICGCLDAKCKICCYSIVTHESKVDPNDGLRDIT